MKTIIVKCGSITRELKYETIEYICVSDLAAVYCNDSYFCRNGKKLDCSETLHDGDVIHVCSRLPGGKGGFGSMLRAIGAQIEKTTNREACRDLSGRRLRDINEEMRLKKWIAKQQEQKQDKDALRLEALEKKLAVPKHEFSDATYDKERSDIPDRVNDAVAQGLATATTSVKRPACETKSNPKKLKLWHGLGDDLDVDSDISSDEKSDEESSNQNSDNAQSTTKNSDTTAVHKSSDGSSGQSSSKEQSDESTSSAEENTTT